MGLRAPQLHGTEVSWWLGLLLSVFLFLFQAPLLGAFHTLIYGLRGSWGQPFLWGVTVGMRLGNEVGNREGSGSNRVSDFGMPNEHKTREKVLRGGLEGRD